MVQILGSALLLAEIDGLHASTLGNKLHTLLKQLIQKGYPGLAKQLVDSQKESVMSFIAEFSEFCLQLRHADMLEHLFLLDLAFTRISAGKMVDGFLRWLPDDHTISDEKYTPPLVMLSTIIDTPGVTLTRDPAIAVLKRLQLANEINLFLKLYTALDQPPSVDYLNNRLACALANDQGALVTFLMSACQKPRDVWDQQKWSPTLAMFEAVIYRSRDQYLLTLLELSSDSLINQALSYAASIGQKQMVQTIVERQISLNKEINIEAVLHSAVGNGKKEVVIYLFENLPDLTMAQKRKAIDCAPENFREEMEDLVKKDALVEGRFRQMKAKLPMAEVSEEELNKQLMNTLYLLEKTKITGSSEVIITADDPMFIIGGPTKSSAANSNIVEAVEPASTLKEQGAPKQERRTF